MFGAILDRHVTGELRPVADDDVVADVAVVREMHVRHDEQLRPTVVRRDSAVPRLIVEYSRITVPSPISTNVSSPSNLRSCGSPPRTDPMPMRTFGASVDVAFECRARGDDAAVADDALLTDDGERTPIRATVRHRSAHRRLMTARSE